MSPLQKIKTPGEKGLSLVEVVVGIALFSVLALLLAGVLSGSAQVRQSADADMTATFLALQKKEDIMARPWDSVQSEARAPVDAANYPGFEREVEIVNKDTNVKKITVKVYYPRAGSTGKGVRVLVFEKCK